MYKSILKRFLDFTLTMLGLIVLSPILFVLCVLVRMKLGSPIFFKQVRITKGEKPFVIMKFRTMTDARDDEGNLLPDTERFTKFGNFLRNSSLDELPELINVLKGEMSLVGPRPLYPFYLPYYTKEESLRHTVRAGITGLAQINGRNLCKWDERFAMDVKYVKELSFVNDIMILWRTVFKVTAQENIGVPSVDEELGLHIVREVQQPEKMELLKNMRGAKMSRSSLPFIIPRIKEIGSHIWLSENEYKLAGLENDLDNIVDDRGILLSTCRSAIKEVLRYIQTDNKIALVPSFTCHSVIMPFIDQGYKVEPYPIQSNLMVDPIEFWSCVKKYNPSVVLLHSYFGFNTLGDAADAIKEIKEQGVTIIEDFTQRLFSTFPSVDANYEVGSIRKWYPIPDGAFLRGDIVVNLEKEDYELAEKKIKGFLDKGKYVEDGSVEKEVFMKELNDAESLLDSRSETYLISKISKKIISASNKDSLIKKRRANYIALLDHIKSNDTFMVLFNEIGDSVVPFMFPLLVKKNRKEFQSYLAAHSVYATIIWGCPEQLKDKIDEKAKQVYDEILCIPVDQIYDNDDMQRVVFTINKYIANE